MTKEVLVLAHKACDYLFGFGGTNIGFGIRTAWVCL